MIKLEMCPFCGGYGKIEAIPMNDGRIMYSATCGNPFECYVIPQTGLCDTPEKAAEVWNRRAGKR